jgi:arylsulfatase A-like enzyme
MMFRLNRPGQYLLIALLLCIAAYDCRVTCAVQPPNIILCMGDDHAWDETAYNGHPYLQTPALDEMAAQGLRFDRFYSAAPSCSPTRGSVLTGRHPNRYGTFTPNCSIRPEEITIAHILRSAGYACGHFGKWHVGPVKLESPTSPGAMGFEEWLSHDNFFEIDPVLSHNGGPPQRFRGESSEVIVQRAQEFMDKAQQRKRPFLAVIWFGSPHEPYRGLPEDLALYNDLPREFAQRTVKLTSNETGTPVERPLRDVLRERYAEITAMDRAIGQLRDYLRQARMHSNTLLWYCGDNGIPPSGRATTPLRGQKGQVYDGGIRVPGIIEWPARVTMPRITNVNAVTSDMLPTICELVGLSLPDRPLDGISLVPLINGQMTSRPKPICFWQYKTGRNARRHQTPYIDPQLQQGTTPLVKKMAGRWTRNFVNFHHRMIEPSDYLGPRAILDSSYKLVLHEGVSGDANVELFDMQDDPAEKKNIASLHPDTVDRLQQQLRRWQQSVLHSLTEADYDMPKM